MRPTLRVFAILLVIALTLLPNLALVASAQAPAADTLTPEPPTATATNTQTPTWTPVPTDAPTDVPTDQPTAIPPTADATATATSTPEGPTPEPPPVPIPEPVTTILFGTGLAALSAAVAARRRNKK